ncbi:MAG: hypothetical protein K8U03_12050 [Planctomycetia bacterium]|nr:hypothetical protein [Planctomycetia bacterium]
MQALIEWIETAPYPQAIAALLVENLIVFFFAFGTLRHDYWKTFGTLPSDKK